MSEKDKKTQVIEDNINPLYYETIEILYEVRDMYDLSSYPPFILDLYDQDEEFLDNTDDFLGRAIIEPKDCSIIIQKDFEKCSVHNEEGCMYCIEERTNKEIPDQPRWHPLRYAVGEPMSGEILVSFSVSKTDYNYVFEPQSVNLRSRAQIKEFDASLLILGLREL